MAEDRAMARQRLGFPLLLAAHDHDPYVEQVEGCWIVKTGCDAVNAAIIDITWASHETPGDQPTVEVQVVKCRDYPENLDLTERVREHNRIVEQLEQAYLIDTPIGVHLVSAGIRRSESTLATFLCTLLRDGFRSSFMCDGVLIDAGAIRRNHTYPEHYTQFTYGDLKKEIPFDTEMVVVSLPGSVVAEAVRASRARAFLDPPEDWGGYMQLDEGFRWDAATNTVTHIDGAPIEADREYHVAVLLLSLNGMNRNQPLIDWANANADKIPLEEAARKAKDVIVDRCSKEIIARLGDFHDIDMDGDGLLSMHEIMAAMSKFLKREVTEVEVSNFMEAMDKDKSGSLSVRQSRECVLSRFCSTSMLDLSSSPDSVSVCSDVWCVRALVRRARIWGLGCWLSSVKNFSMQFRRSSTVCDLPSSGAGRCFTVPVTTPGVIKIQDHVPPVPLCWSLAPKMLRKVGGCPHKRVFLIRDCRYPVYSLD
jgi:hypothetical protein